MPLDNRVRASGLFELLRVVERADHWTWLLRDPWPESALEQPELLLENLAYDRLLVELRIFVGLRIGAAALGALHVLLGNLLLLFQLLQSERRVEPELKEPFQGDA